MNTSSAQDRVKVYRVLDQLCEARDMFYETTNHHIHIHGKLFNKHKKLIGLAGIESDNRKFGSKPVVVVNGRAVDFLFELGELTGLAMALVVKFRDKVAYWRMKRDDLSGVNYFMTDEKGNPKYILPINLFRLL